MNEKGLSIFCHEIKRDHVIYCGMAYGYTVLYEYCDAGRGLSES
jgi:hypothetical protein